MERHELTTVFVHSIRQTRDTLCEMRIPAGVPISKLAAWQGPKRKMDDMEDLAGGERDRGVRSTILYILRWSKMAIENPKNSGVLLGNASASGDFQIC